MSLNREPILCAFVPIECDRCSYFCPFNPDREDPPSSDLVRIVRIGTGTLLAEVDRFRGLCIKN